MQPMVNLGCINGTNVNELVTVSLAYPINGEGVVLQWYQLLQMAQAGENSIPDRVDPSFLLGSSFDGPEGYNYFQRNLLGARPYAVGTPGPSQQELSTVRAQVSAPENLNCRNVQDNIGVGISAICEESQDLNTSNNSLYLSQPSPVPNAPTQAEIFGNTVEPGTVQYEVRQQQINSTYSREISNTIISPNISPYQNFEQDGLIDEIVITGISQPSSQMVFQNNVYLTSETNVYSNTYVNSGYSNVPLSQEGLLWTLWPLAKTVKQNVEQPNQTYFDNFVFGTAIQSKYAIGQMAYFINNREIGCIQFNHIFPTSTGASSANVNNISGGPYNLPVTAEIDGIVASLYANLNVSVGQPAEKERQGVLGIIPGIQGLNSTLITTTQQMVALVVIKVTEQVARIPNPVAGVGSNQNFIYVGYDGWSVVRTTANPIEPMAAQTYVTPQSVTGSVVDNNYQIVFPPNFPQSIFYKNVPRTAPTNTSDGLFIGSSFPTVGTNNYKN